MTVELAFDKPWLVVQPESEIELDELPIQQPDLEHFMANFEFPFQLWELRVAIGRIRPTPEEAPNIDVKNDFDVLRNAGSEKVWRVLNGLKEGESPNPQNIRYPIGEVYKLKRLSDLPFAFNAFRNIKK